MDETIEGEHSLDPGSVTRFWSNYNPETGEIDLTSVGTGSSWHPFAFGAPNSLGAPNFAGLGTGNSNNWWQPWNWDYSNRGEPSALWGRYGGNTQQIKEFQWQFRVEDKAKQAKQTLCRGG